MTKVMSMIDNKCIKNQVGKDNPQFYNAKNNKSDVQINKTDKNIRYLPSLKIKEL